MQGPGQYAPSREVREAIALILGEPGLGPRALRSLVDDILARGSADAQFRAAVTGGLSRIRDGLTHLIGLLEEQRRAGTAPMTAVFEGSGPTPSQAGEADVGQGLGRADGAREAGSGPAGNSTTATHRKS